MNCKNRIANALMNHALTIYVCVGSGTAFIVGMINMIHSIYDVMKTRDKIYGYDCIKRLWQVIGLSLSKGIAYGSLWPYTLPLISFHFIYAKRLFKDKKSPYKYIFYKHFLTRIK